MPHDQFIALAQGCGGAEAVENLVKAQHSRHMIMLHGVLRAAREGGRPDDQLAVAGYELLAHVQRSDPDAVSAVVRYPSVGAWALRVLRGDESIPGTHRSGLAAIGAAAAIRAGIAAEIEVQATDGRVVLPSLGAAAVTGPRALVRTSPGVVIDSAGGHVEVAPGAAGWQELRSIQVGSLDVVVDDLDPFRMPAGDGEPTGRLTASEVSELARTLRDGRELLDPLSAGEIAALVRVIVPYRPPESGYVSTSSADAFGAVGMSRQPDRYTCAETLVHEAQHQKLSALLDLVRLANPDDERRYYAPWREDPRPAGALLQGAYAFFGVSDFWRRQRQVAPEEAIRLRADTEFARWRDGAALAVDTLLASGQLTAAGLSFLGEMARVLGAWRGEQVAPEALAIAQGRAEQHLRQWHADNGHGGTVATVPGLAC
ncbi:MAG TPA: HEXXH motif domain-containing protein [Trebonia sp.]|nr:HEXXH motif domain-containing protein [Trebonia sp.]